MPRNFEEDTLLIATHNKGKIADLELLFKNIPVKILTANDIQISEPEETEKTFEGNARLKAIAAMKETGLPSLADDSGLCVEALNGAPGIYSARWAGPDRDWNMAIDKIKYALGDDPNRNAEFVSTLALAWPDGHVEIFEGKMKGKLVWPKRGLEGFGYDPIFQPDGHIMTFAEMTPKQKNSFSHRKIAMKKMIEACFSS